MNFHYPAYTTHRPRTHSSSHFNEDARCDNEVNLILEKNYNQQLIEQSIIKEQQQQQQQQSVVVNQTDQYYFMPIREQSSIMALPSTNNSNMPDGSSILLADLQNPSRENLFDYSISTPNSSTVNKGNDTYNLTDADLAALFVSSIVSTTPSTINSANENTLEHSNALDDVFIQQMNELVCSNPQSSFGPPPGFENFRMHASENSTSSHAAALQSQVSSSDTINFSQLLPSATVDSQQAQQTVGGNLRSSSSSHSSFTSDEQSMFFPLPTHHYSSSQISSSSSTTTASSNAKQLQPGSLSKNPKLFSSIETNTTATQLDGHQDGDVTPNHMFASPNSFFSNGQKKAAKLSTSHRQSSSSTSSSTSSSIDDALTQLNQQQQQQQQQTAKKLFSNESLSMFNFPSNATLTSIDKEQQAVHENINFLASMAAASTPVTPESPWQQPSAAHANPKPQRQSASTIHSKQSPSKPSAISMQEFLENLNETCYRGFDELNALIQEQRWVQNYLNVNSSSPNSPLVNIYGANACSARILIVPEYLIFKCKKVEMTASHVYELLATGRPELRLKDLMFVFKSWKEAITNAEVVHQEEEMKLRLTIEHSQNYYMNDTVLQAAFERVSYAIRQLSSMTQQARAAFQYATLNVFQMSSRQQQQQQQQGQQSLSASTSNLSQSANALALAQLQAMQQPKSASIHRLGGSIHTSP